MEELKLLYEKGLCVADFLPVNIMETIIRHQADDRRQVRRPLAEFHLIRRRIGSAVITLLVIAYLTLLGLLLAARGREHLPAQPLNAMWQSAVELVNVDSTGKCNFAGG